MSRSRSIRSDKFLKSVTTNKKMSLRNLEVKNYNCFFQEHSCTSHCAKLSENDRATIFKDFSTSNEFKKFEFIQSMIKLHEWKDADDVSRVHRSYFLPKNGKMIRVCRTTFSNILHLQNFEIEKYIRQVEQFRKAKQEVEPELKVIKRNKRPLNRSNREKSPRRAKCPKKLNSRKRLSTLDIRMEIPKLTAAEIQNLTKKSSSATPVPLGSSTVPVESSPIILDSFKLSLPEKEMSSLRVCTWTQTNSEDLKETKSTQTVLTGGAMHYSNLVPSPPLEIKIVTQTDPAMNNIEKHPKMFTGMKNLSWLNKVCDYIGSSKKDLCIVLQKLYLNESLGLLAIHFQRTEENIKNTLNYYMPIIYGVLKDILDWENSDVISNAIPRDLKYKFGSLRSILKLCRAKINDMNYKFIISITPLGTISFVSKLVEETQFNLNMISDSKFCQKAPPHCGIILDDELGDVQHYLIEAGFSVFVNRNIQDEEMLYSAEGYLKRDIDIISQKAMAAYARFKKFKIINEHVSCDIGSVQIFNFVASIIGVLVNLQALEMTFE